MGNLTTLIVVVKPREKSGARTGARYAFQAHASLDKLLERHKSGADYRAIFDHFDDLTILDSSHAPVEAEFFQIKGKETGGWTAASLCTVAPEVPKTIIGKMYHHTQAFGPTTKSCVFLTNSDFKFVLSDGTSTTPDHTQIGYGELGAKDRARFAAALDLDFAPPRTPGEETVIRFERSEVPLKGYDVFLKGRLVDFVADMPAVTVGALYRTLIESIAAKASSTTDCNSLDAVYDHKSIARSEIEATFKAAEKHESILDSWLVIAQELAANSRSPVERIRAKTAVVQYLRDRSKRTLATTELAAAIATAAGAAKAVFSIVDSLHELTRLILSKIEPSVAANTDPSMLEAALLTAAFEIING